MRFASHESPLLLEVLGDLLSHNAYKGPSDAKRLRGASISSGELCRWTTKIPRRLTFELADHALTLQFDDRRTGESQLPLSAVEERFKVELANADAWYATLRSKEQDWIANTRRS